MHGVCTHAFRCWNLPEVLGPLGAGVIDSVSHLKRMLGIQPGSSERAVCALSHGAISPGPEKQHFLRLVLIAGHSSSKPVILEEGGLP